MPIEITPAGPENIPDTGFPEGHVSAANNPAEPPLQHRPHAFALMHGDGGAKVAYGQLAWRIDVLQLSFATASGPVDEAGQLAIAAFNIKIPTIDSSTGEPMDRTAPNTYNQLDGYGDVYLYWETSLSEEELEDRVDACWVQVGGSSPAEDELDAVTTAAGAFGRFYPTTGSPSTEQLEGTYRVKLGTVNEDELVKQDHASDVYWSTVLLERYGG